MIYSEFLRVTTTTIQPILSIMSEIWQTLIMTYAKPSRVHVKQICQQIQNWKKCSKSINEYFKSIKGLTTRFDELALLGKVLDHEDQIEFVLDGLLEEYKTIADQIDGRETPPSLPEIHEKLLNQKAKLQSITIPATPAPVTANLINHMESKNQNHRNYKNYNSCRGGYRGNQTWQQQQMISSPQQQNSSRGYQGECQICSVFGYSARRCPQLHSGTSHSNQITTQNNLSW